MKFDIELLNKGQADCFLVLLENDRGDECNILIDGNCQGIKSDSLDKVVERISKLKKLDCIVVTHIDNDHIGGVLSLFERDKDVLSCISKQLKESIIVYNNVIEGIISYSQAECFEELIRNKKVINSFNERYENERRMLHFLSIKLRRILEFNEDTEKNVYVTFLNPDRQGAKKVINDYKKYKDCGKQSDKKLINKNSIVLLIEFGEKKVLFTGDAYSEDIKMAIDVLKDKSLLSNVNKIDWIKIPHHGAYEYNKSLVSLAKNIDCSNFILTGKSEWDEKHPSQEILENLLDEFSDVLKIYTEVDLASINDKFAKTEERFLKEIHIL
ncbi:MBL fold metallo-hydrolase [Clostridium estertheticum]|uniref:MBL fold metallo-hydrolase n=1 Tax=Clostridium estertheticum TaxID=238834 RepID=UPI001CF2EC65|nr:MBL fold metallo-hydrolase [Clostridium estertheticum]MCB2354372.1 MBL fold metallo-hydrolase [Clostridium estertheticum]WAG42509.1 MBL fold metallo-hydrolase [Clostridium estertheticum]